MTEFLRLHPHESKTVARPSVYWTGIGSPGLVLAFNHFGRHRSLRPGVLTNALKDTASGLLAPVLDAVIRLDPRVI